MKASASQGFFWFVVLVAIGLVVPSLIIFCLEVFVAHVSPVASVADILRRQFAEGHNLFLIALFGLVPFAALAVICRAAARRLSPARLACLGVGGLLGILGLMIPGHVAVWYPLYGPDPGSGSSTAVIAFVFIPWYCLVTLGVGLLIGYGVSLLPVFRNESKRIA